MNQIKDIPSLKFEDSAYGKRIINREEIYQWLIYNEVVAHNCYREMHYIRLEESDKDLYLLLHYVYICIKQQNLLLEAVQNKPTVIVMPTKAPSTPSQS